MIVTHTSPDWDAITGVWLLDRYHKSGIMVDYVNTGNPDREALQEAFAVVDTGGAFDPDDLRFDHHQFKGARASETCATEQVFNFLRGGNHLELEYLRPLIDLVLAGDTGRAGAAESRQLGIHAQLSSFKASVRGQEDSDEMTMNFGFSILNALVSHLEAQAKAKAELAKKVVYKSDDGLIWAIKHGSIGSSFAAYEEGAVLVVFEGSSIEVADGTTYPIGVSRKGEATWPNVGGLIEGIAEQKLYQSDNDPMAQELDRWFCHPAGFFAGRGTPKSPVFAPIKVELVELAKAIDGAWTQLSEELDIPRSNPGTYHRL